MHAFIPFLKVNKSFKRENPTRKPKASVKT